MDGGLRKIPWARVWVAAAAVTGIAVLIVVLLVTDRVPASEPPPPQAPAPAPSMSPGVLSSERLRIPAFGLSYEAGARRDHHRACDGPGNVSRQASRRAGRRGRPCRGDAGRRHRPRRPGPASLDGSARTPSATVPPPSVSPSRGVSAGGRLPPIMDKALASRKRCRL